MIPRATQCGHGHVQGIFVDGEGYVAEGPTMNVAILTKGGELLVSSDGLGVTIYLSLNLVLTVVHMA